MDVFDAVVTNVNELGNSKYFIGIMMIILNLGGRFIFNELGQNHERLFNNTITRRILVFTVFFMATRDIIISAMLSVFFIVLFLELTHEKSPYCVLSKSTLEAFDTNKDCVISPDELRRAYETIQKAQAQQQHNNVAAKGI